MFNRKDIRPDLEEIGASAKDLTNQLNEAVAENRPVIKSALEGVEATVGDVQDIMGTVKEVTGQLDTMVATLEVILDNGSTMSNDLRQLLEDNQWALEDIIVDVRETMRNLKSFTRTLSEEPQSIIRGKSVKGRTE